MLCGIMVCCDKSTAVAEVGDRLATIDMGRKEGDCCAPFREGGAVSPSNTMWLRPRSTSSKNIPQGRPLPPEILAPSDLPTPEGSEF